MNGEKLASVALIAALLAVGGAAWWLQLRAPLRVDAAPLATLPLAIDGWRGHEIPLEGTVEAILRADFNLQRAYEHSAGGLVWLYVGYYGTERGGRPEHTPRGCYTGAGWDIEAARTVDVTPASRLRANEYRVAKRGEQRLVQFWYRSSRRTGILGGFDQNLDRMLGHLRDGRADGALVRLSTPIDAGDEVAARSRLVAFAAQLDPLLADRWPTEMPTR